MTEPIRVVLIDDHGLCRRGLSELLEQRAGIRVLGNTGNPDEAVQLLKDGRPDLAIMDLRMAPVDGFALLARLRAEGIDTPVVVLTMSDLKDDLARAFRAGVRGYLLKDAPVEKLAQALRDVHRGGRAIAPELAVDAWREEADPLTDRERAVLRLAGEGLSSQDIAEKLHLSNRTQAAAYAVSHGYVVPPGERREG